MTTTPQPSPSIDLHEHALEQIENAIDQLTFGVGRAAERTRFLVQPPTFARMLACVDGSVASARVVEWAAHLAPLHHARVIVASVATPPPSIGTGMLAVPQWPELYEESRASERMLRDAAETAATRLRQLGIDAQAITTIGSPPREIAQLARTHHADLVILGAKGGGRVSRVLLGSVAEAVSGRVTSSILVARTPPRPARILAATDGSEESCRAVAAALELASAGRGELIVEHVIEHPAEPSSEAAPEGHLKRVLEDLALAKPPRVRYVLDVGPPAEQIVKRAQAEGVMLVVMGARGLGRVTGALLGSVSHRVANTSSASTLIVRSSV